MESEEALSDLELSKYDDLLPKGPKVLRISRKEIFLRAAEELQLNLQSETTTEDDGGMFITEITISKTVSNQPCEREIQKVVGKSAGTKKIAIENAYQTLLEYLETGKQIVIDDYNAEHVSQLKKEQLCSNTWLMLFEDKAKKLQENMNAKHTALCNFFSSFEFMCQEASLILSLLPTKEQSTPAKKPRREMIPSGSKTDLSAAANMLSETLLKLRSQLLGLLAASTDDESTLLKKTKLH